MIRKIMEPGTGDGAQGPYYLPNASWTNPERYSKQYTYKFP